LIARKRSEMKDITGKINSFVRMWIP